MEWCEVAAEVECFHRPQRVQVDAATEVLDLLVAVFALILYISDSSQGNLQQVAQVKSLGRPQAVSEPAFVIHQ
jgi:hypothetical protein